MRDPYPVLVARNWARDMAAIECLLFIGCLIVLATMGFTNQDATVAEKDDDSINVLGVDLTGQIGLKEEYVWAYIVCIHYFSLLLIVWAVAVIETSFALIFANEGTAGRSRCCFPSCTKASSCSLKSSP